MWRVCGPSAGWGVACHWVLRLVRALGTSNARACCGLSWYAADAGSAGCCEHHVCGVYTYDLRLTKSTLASHSRKNTQRRARCMHDGESVACDNVGRHIIHVVLPTAEHTADQPARVGRGSAAHLRSRCPCRLHRHHWPWLDGHARQTHAQHYQSEFCEARRPLILHLHHRPEKRIQSI
jgi:hypothetical protein